MIKLMIDDKSISPMIFKVNQFSNSDVIEFTIINSDVYEDLIECDAYFVVSDKAYKMSKSVLSDSVVLRLRMKDELTENAHTFIYQVVLRDSYGKIRWYSNKGVYIVSKSLEVDFENTQELSSDTMVSVACFKVLYDDYIIGVPYLYEEV